MKKLLLVLSLLLCIPAYGQKLSALPQKTTPVVADRIAMMDTEAANVAKTITITNLYSIYPLATGGTGLLTVAKGGTGIGSGTSGGVPFFNSGTTMASSGALALNSLLIGGGAGNAPSSVTTGANVLNGLSQSADSASGFITGSGNVALTGSKTYQGLTISTTTGTLTIPNGVVFTGPAASGTAETLGNAETITGAKTVTVTPAASTPSYKFTNTPYAAGTATTNFPLVYLNDSTATASSTMSTAGTYLGVNGHGSADLLNLMLDGVSKLKVASDGTLTVSSIAVTTLIATNFRIPVAAGSSSLTTSGDMAYNTTNKVLGIYNGTKEVGISTIYHQAWSFDPKAICDGTIDRLFLLSTDISEPFGIHVIKWKLSFEADPTTEIDLDLKRADAFIGVANSAVMDALDTTAGASSEATSSNINGDAVVATSKVLYLEFGTAYSETGHQCVFEMWWEVEED